MVVMGFDGRMVAANLQSLQLSLDRGVPKGVLNAAMELLRLSQLEVPHDEGTLQNSGSVEVLPNGDVVMGYHTPYAARLHEHPEYRFQRGRKGKYIEDPIHRNMAVLQLQMVKGINQNIGGLGSL